MAEPTPKSRKYRWILASLLLGAGLVVLLGRDRAQESRIPAPELGELPVSALTVEVVYSPDQMTETLESRVPLVLGGLTSRRSYPSDPRLQYAFEAQRDPFELEIRGDTVHLSTIVRYAGQVWLQTPFGAELTASCGILDGRPTANAPRAAVAFSSPVGVDSNWNLSAEVRVDRVEPLTPADRCIVSAFALQLDATDPILNEVRRWLDLEAAAVDSAIAATSLRPAAEAGWALIQEPIALAPDAWMTLNPVGVGYPPGGSSGSRGQQIHGQLDVALQPKVVFGGRPVPVSRPLPTLSTAIPADALVAVEGQIEYGPLTEVILAEAAGQSFAFAGRTMEVRSLELSGSDDGRMSAELEVAGTLAGRIRLVGTPQLDAVGEEIHFPDLTFSLETENLLARAAVWLLRRPLTAYARQHARLPVQETFTRQLELVEQTSLPLAEAAVEARFEALEVTGVRAGPRGILLRVRLRPQVVLSLG